MVLFRESLNLIAPVVIPPAADVIAIFPADELSAPFAVVVACEDSPE